MIKQYKNMCSWARTGASLQLEVIEETERFNECYVKTDEGTLLKVEGSAVRQATALESSSRTPPADSGTLGQASQP
jgi:hypothetical protein